MAHTPGPWIVTDEGLETAACDVVLITVSVGHPPLQIPHADNLQLMAAAPDLLAALTSARAAFYKCMTVNGTDPEFAVLACASYDAAIAKAEGR